MSKRGAALAVLVGIQFLNYFDRNVTPAVAAQVQHDFALSDAQLGLAGSIFILAFALAVLPLGRWADRGARRKVIGLVVGVWGLATFASGLARSYWQLLAARAVLGIGEAGYYPAASSMLADHYGKEQRGRAFGPINSGVALGAAAGMIVSGIIATRIGWRPAFFVAGVPALVLALLAFRLPEPRRGAAENVVPAAAAVTGEVQHRLADLLHVRSFVAAVLASAFMFAAGQGLGFWLALNTRRTFGLDTAQAASVSGVALLIGGIGGPLVGGWLADWRGRRSTGGQLEVVVGAAVVAILACLLALNSPSLPGYLAGLAILVGAGLTPLVALSALVQGIVVPPLRGSATAILGLVTQLLSAGAPYAIGALSDSVGDLRLALLLIVPASLAVGALAAAWGLPTVKSDTAAMEQRWAAASAA